MKYIFLLFLLLAIPFSYAQWDISDGEPRTIGVAKNTSLQIKTLNHDIKLTIADWKYLKVRGNAYTLSFNETNHDNIVILISVNGTELMDINDTLGTNISVNGEPSFIFKSLRAKEDLLEFELQQNIPFAEFNPYKKSNRLGIGILIFMIATSIILLIYKAKREKKDGKIKTDMPKMQRK